MPPFTIGAFSFRISCFLWQIKVQLLQVITAFLHKKRMRGVKALFMLMDFATALLLTIPLLFLHFKCNYLEHCKRQLFSSIGLLNFLTTYFMISFGDIFWIVLIWQLVFIWPICIAYYLYLYKQDQHSYYYLGLRKKHILWIGTLTIISIFMVFIGMYETNKKIIVFHQQVMQDFEDSTDRQLYLIEHTITPATLLGLSDQIEKVSGGQVRALTLPWRSKVIVTIDNREQKEFTYVRLYDGWKLDGIYRESYTMDVDRSTEND